MSGIIGSVGSKSGVIGDLTVSDDLTVSGDIVPSTPLSHRNMIINGDMQVAQRGTSFTGQGGANKSYTLDRFSTEWYNGSETAKFTITRDALGTSDLPRVNEGLSYSYKIDCTTAIADQNANANNLQSLDYRIEAQDLQHLRYGTSSAQTVCLSFWFKSPKSGIHIVGVMQDDNSNKIYLREFTIASADTWQKIAVTFPGDTSGVINNDTGLGFRIIWPLYAGNNRQGAKDSWRALSLDYTTSSQQNLLDNTANNICITGVQLELGSSATPFEHRSYGEELARCQRYYQRAEFKQGVFHGTGFIRLTNSTCFIGYSLQKKMRVAPTTISIPTIGQESGNFTFLVGESYPSTHGSLASTQTTSDHVHFLFTGYSILGTAYTNTWAYVTGPANVFFTFDSEL
jgi:hypothetical protein